jgi:hypothetical protein
MSAGGRSTLLPRDPHHEFVRVMTRTTVEKSPARDHLRLTLAACAQGLALALSGKVCG